jgi:hypothetical protein
MSEKPTGRSVKIGADERTGWSSERPRSQAGPPRPVDISGRCTVLSPAFRMRYSPGSLLLVVGAAATDPDAFADRVIEERGVVISPSRVRTLLAGRVGAEEIDERARELLGAAVAKRLEANQSVVVPLAGFDRDERETFIRAAHKLRRPRHLILLDGGRDEVSDDERPALDELRRAVDAGDVGAEGFQTALRLGGAARSELKKVVFQPAPRDD